MINCIAYLLVGRTVFCQSQADGSPTLC